MKPVHFYETGTGYPLVFLHGFCESGSLWKELSEVLSDEFRIICPDLPGFGQSPLPDKEFSLTDIANQLATWLKNLGIEKCIVIGHSLGGYVSLEMLRHHGELVKGIGLFNSSAYDDPADKKENRNKLIAFIGENGVAPFLKTFVPSLFYHERAYEHRATIENIRKEGLSIKPESVMSYAAAMRDRVSSIDLLESNPDLILLISGEEDQNVPIDISRQMGKLLNNENVHFMPESAHMSVFEHRDLSYDAIRSFARKFSSI